jgi:hypothetical protein
MSYSCNPGQHLRHVAEATGGHSRVTTTPVKKSGTPSYYYSSEKF